MASLAVEASMWRDTSDWAKKTVERFTKHVNIDEELKAHRDFVEQHVYGFGERAFWWMWKLLVDEMPQKFGFLEIGVYKGAIPSLIRLLADRSDKQASISGITPLSGEGGRHDSYPDEDYLQHITDLHEHFGQKMPKIYHGLSGDKDIQAKIKRRARFDIIYIDGGHDYEVALADMVTYGPRVKPGGYLVIDDCATYLAPVWGHYQGIKSVSDAARAVIETDPGWEHVLSVMHNRIWKRVGEVGEYTLDPPMIQEYAWGPGHKAVRL